jgi:hypothetical protein
MKVLVKIVQVLVHQGVDRVVCNLYDFTESKNGKRANVLKTQML